MRIRIIINNKKSKTMPEIKANEPLPKRPVVIVIYGEPGIGKTSLFNTAANPYLIDFDRGVSRSILRKDTLAPDNWEEVMEKEASGRFKDFSTIGIDTAKACLDDFLMSYVVKKDFKNAKNKLAAYGAIGDEFKIFVSNRRSENADLIIIAHSKDDKDGDTTKKIPDVTGGSYQVLLRIADQVGYMSTKNNKRTIQWEPTDNTIGKNVARLPVTEIPAETDPALRTFMATIVEKVKSSLCAQSEAQTEALQKSEAIQKEIEAATTFADLSMIVSVLVEQPPYLQVQLLQVLTQKATGFIPSITTVDQLNEALKFFRAKPLAFTKKIQDEMKVIQDNNKWGFDKTTKLFVAPPQPVAAKQEPVDDLKALIPGPSLTDPVTEGKEQELAFN